MDHDQLFKAVITAQLAPFLEMFFPDETLQLDLTLARFVDKELFAAPPLRPARAVDLLVKVPLLARPGAETRPGQGTLVAVHIEVQSQREPEFVWRMLEYYALLSRIRGTDVFPIALFPMVDVLGKSRGQRPPYGYETVVQQSQVLGHPILSFEFLAVTLPSLDAERYLNKPQALAGALAAWMRRRPRTPLSEHKLACLRRIIEGSGVSDDVARSLLLDVVETRLRLLGEDAEQFELLLRRPENQGVRESMKTWLEEQQELAAIRKAQEDVVYVLEAKFGPVPADIAAKVRQISDEAVLKTLLARAATASSLSETGLT